MERAFESMHVGQREAIIGDSVQTACAGIAVVEQAISMIFETDEELEGQAQDEMDRSLRTSSNSECSWHPLDML